ncbi:MAG: HAD family hydrolase [Fibrobacterota bacterium]|nr:HAD-IA family hydrolase [Chitinispirillaceae bacterium]
MRDYTYYLFDADGTLIDTTELIWQCFENTARMTGHGPIGRETTIKHIGMTLRDQMTINFGILDDEAYDRYRTIHMDYQMSVYREYLKLFPGVSETLDKLKKNGKKLAIVTSRFRNSLDVYLRDTGIFAFFDAIISPESTKYHKPHPEPAIKAMEELKARQSETLFIGDATFDIECGAGAGIDTAFVKWSVNDVDSLKRKPTWLINAMGELII